MKELLKRSWPDVAVVFAFLVLSFVYFASPVSRGLVLGGHDTVAGMGLGQEQTAFLEATGERTRWTNSAFSGMPTYQISPSYDSTDALGVVGRIIALFTTGPVSYLFLYLLGFYILMRAFRFKPLLSAFGAVAWAFSSYFFIIIAAGHLWKVSTLAFIPPTIAGLVLAYRGKYLWGGLVTALFTALQVLNNHIQMTYYFLFLMAFLVVAHAVDAFRKGEHLRWCKATAVVVAGGLIGALINLSNLYHTWEYSKESMRGAGELSSKTQTDLSGRKATGGLDREYITAWSYGIDETLTLMIANFKGGGSQSIMERDDAQDIEGYDDFYNHASQLYQATGGGYLPGMSQYWGNQPMTVGPVYVGAIICFLFVLGLFVVRGPTKWALLAATVLSLLFAWGKNWMSLTDVFIDYLPMYAKFRTVSSALVVAEFTMPLLAILGLAEVLRRPEMLGQRRGRIAFGASFALTAGLCLLFALAPGVADVMSQQDRQIFEEMKSAGLPADFLSGYSAAVETMHKAILSADAWRSFLLIAAAALLIVLHTRRPKFLPAWSVVSLLLVMTLADMWNVNRRYLNADSFSEPEARQQGFAKTAADLKILADSDPNFRVANLGVGNPFNETSNQTAYWHKSVGGYHPAKLHRYQDLIDRYLLDECVAVTSAVNRAYASLTADSAALAAKGLADEDRLFAAVMQGVPTDSLSPVLNMLNTKWFILSQGKVALRNPSANGNGWFVRSLRMVDNADAEIAALKQLDNKREAVADKRFADRLDGSSLGEGSVKLTSYSPNELRYTTESAQGGVVVFSEIYYPGWTASIDGKTAEIGRANYLLRALKVPAGRHEVVLTFHPSSVSTTETVARIAFWLLMLGFAFVLLGDRLPNFRRQRPTS